MDLSRLDSILEGQPGFRRRQVHEAVYKQFISSWPEASNLGKDLVARLEAEAPLAIQAKEFTDQEKRTTKAVIELADGGKVETVLMRHPDGRNTVCVSSQIGCPLGCLFCATGKAGFVRNLSRAEIIEQCLYFSRKLKAEGERISNIVFMGMGEPFLNYDEVLAAIRFINDPNGLGIGARHISISTAGITEGIRRLADEDLQVNLSLSLHGATDQKRAELMPIGVHYNIKKIIPALEQYLKKTNRQVMIEYLMINGFNDTDEDAEMLAGLLQPFGGLAVVNLIRYNETGRFRPSSPERVQMFQQQLSRLGVRATIRQSYGDKMMAACGQLADSLKKK